MTAGRMYLAGTLLIAGLAGWMAARSVGTVAASIWLALGVSLAIQGPLGWWLVRSIGTEGFLAVWVGGILARFGLLGAMGLVILPRLNWPLASGMIALLLMLLGFLLLEGIVLWVERSRAEA